MTTIMEGKTKIIRGGPDADTVYMETKDQLTGGDAARRESIAEIGIDKTAQAANVFRLLQRCGLPVSFIEQTSPRALLCHRCDMLPLELVVRRFAWGSFLLRHPEYRAADGMPTRFDQPFCEFFHKWTVVAQPYTPTPYQMNEDDARQLFLHDGVWAKGAYTDPYIEVADEQWTLYPAKTSLGEAHPLMQIKPLCTPEETRELIEALMIPTFQALEDAWRHIETTHGAVVLVESETGSRSTPLRREAGGCRCDRQR